MNKEQLMQFDKGSEWEKIIFFAGEKGIHDTFEAEIVGKAYRMLGRYDLAIKVFEFGSKISVEGFEKSRFEILIADCLHLQQEKDKADARLRKMEDMYKIKDNHQKYFILGWRDLQLAKYEEDSSKKEHLLSLANVELEASEVVGEYDIILKARLQVTVLQQLSEHFIVENMLDIATQYANDAQKIAEDAALEYETISNLLMIARLELAKQNYDAARTSADTVIKSNLTDRMYRAAQEILEQIK